MAFQALFTTPAKRSASQVFIRFLPFLADIMVRNAVPFECFDGFVEFYLMSQRTEHTRTAAKSLEVMRRFGMQLIKDKKAQIMSSSSGSVEKKDFDGRDILSLLIKANMASDVPDSQRLTDEEVLARTLTLNRVHFLGAC